MQPVLQILENILLLSFIGLGFYVIEGQRQTVADGLCNLLHGVSFGLIAFLVTTTFVPFADGATVDARAAPVILAGYVGGPVAALIAAGFGGFARGLVGDNFVFSGVIAYVVYAGIGSAVWLFRKGKPFDFFNWRLVGGMCIASCLGASAMFFLIEPHSRALAWMQNDLPFIFAANCLGILFATIALGIAWTMLLKSRKFLELYETLQMAQRAGGFGIWDYDIRSGTLNWDRRSRELHEIPDSDFKGTFEDWARCVQPEDRVKAQEHFWVALKSADTYEAEYRVPKADGTFRTIKGTADIVRDSAGAAIRVVGTNLDLTTIREAEQKLQDAQRVAAQAQKFDTIGKMTGGVAHDFNNLLAVIMGNLELAEDELSKTPIDRREITALLHESLEATRRGAGLTRNMLAYARKAKLSPQILDLNDTVRETKSWLRRTIPSQIDIKTVLQKHLWPTRVDKTSLQNALINLLMNARDSFVGSGQITILTANLHVDEEFIADRDEDIQTGRYVMLAVTDTGCGMDAALLQNIFDPFFTTKNVGEGSGLGLSMVEGFVKQSGGMIRVYSEPNIGTSFKMYFPGADTAEPKAVPKADGAAHSQSERAPQTSHNGRILIVEDRAEVLDVLQKTLVGAGYDTVTATSGDEGFLVFEQDPGFDLILTDIVMPGALQGPALAREIRKRDPEMPFVFLSGYASEAASHTFGLEAHDVRLMKPVMRDELLATVASALRRNAAPDVVFVDPD